MPTCLCPKGVCETRAALRIQLLSDDSAAMRESSAGVLHVLVAGHVGSDTQISKRLRYSLEVASALLHCNVAFVGCRVWLQSHPVTVDGQKKAIPETAHVGLILQNWNCTVTKGSSGHSDIRTAGGHAKNVAAVSRSGGMRPCPLADKIPARILILKNMHTNINTNANTSANAKSSVNVGINTKCPGSL